LIQLSGGAGSNNRPIAQNDEYNTPLDLAAPGVLENDNDPEGDPMTAALVATTSEGNLNLRADGGFTYTANDAGGASNVATVTIGVASADEVSINSTSANGALPGTAVAEQTPIDNASYTLVAINDLGMHCGDLDTRISSILPPFNVLHAQVVQRGITALPRVLGEWPSGTWRTDTLCGERIQLRRAGVNPTTAADMMLLDAPTENLNGASLGILSIH
jgi:hypothetical protein